MKKYLFIVLALLLVYGVANATNIPMVTDPKNYPTVWTELVYNGSGSEIATGMVVEWDFDASDSDAGTIYDDMCSWVQLSDAANNVWTAGVTTIGQAIANGSVGRIIIRGPAVVHNNGTPATVNTVCASTSGGYVGTNTPGTDTMELGVVIKADASGNDVEADIGAGSSLIFIDPTIDCSS